MKEHFWLAIGIFVVSLLLLQRSLVLLERRATQEIHDNEGVFFDVTDFGAVGDGQTEDTLAIRKALLKAAEIVTTNPSLTKKTVIYFPANRTFISAPLNLSSNCILRVDGKLQAITNSTSSFHDKWPIIPPLPSYRNSEDAGFVNQYQSFIYARDADHVSIEGSGVIDGRGSWWWDAFEARPRNASILHAGRPNLIQLHNCSNVEISGVTMKDSPFWTLHPVYCQDLHIHHIKIRSRMYAPNVDGIDPDSSQNVMIEHNDISCGDDHIAIKAGRCGDVRGRDDMIHCAEDPKFARGDYVTRNVTIRYNVFRIGMGIALGSELSGGIEDVSVYQNVIGLCEHGIENPLKSCGWGPAIHFKTTLTRGGHIRRVRFHGNIIYNNTGFLLLETDYQDSEHVLPPSSYPTTDVRDLAFDGNTGLGEAVSVSFHCSPYLLCENISMTGTWIENGNPNDYHCAFVPTYNVHSNWPRGLEECMNDSMNRTQLKL